MRTIVYTHTHTHTRRRREEQRRTATLRQRPRENHTASPRPPFCSRGHTNLTPGPSLSVASPNLLRCARPTAEARGASLTSAMRVYLVMLVHCRALGNQPFHGGDIALEGCLTHKRHQLVLGRLLPPQERRAVSAQVSAADPAGVGEPRAAGGGEGCKTTRSDRDAGAGGSVWRGRSPSRGRLCRL